MIYIKIDNTFVHCNDQQSTLASTVSPKFSDLVASKSISVKNREKLVASEKNLVAFATNVVAMLSLG